MTSIDFHTVPKTELHIHLEGSIPHDALFQLIEKYGGAPGITRSESLEERFHFRSFPEFIDAFAWKNGFLREYDDFEFIAEAIAADLAAQNIRYVEMFYSPTSFMEHSRTIQELTAAIRRGFNKVPGTTINLIADFVRDYGPEHEILYLPHLAEVKNLGVIGISLGGSEHAFPPAPFAPLYESARLLGFKTTVHAGEAAGPESIWDALEFLKPDRIGHATRATEDPLLVKHLAEKQIPLELCPGSNVRTGVITLLKNHPVREYFNAGCLISINSDDPWMFGTRLANEYQGLVDKCDFSVEEIHTLIRMAEKSSWNTEDSGVS